MDFVTRVIDKCKEYVGWDTGGGTLRIETDEDLMCPLTAAAANGELCSKFRMFEYEKAGALLGISPEDSQMIASSADDFRDFSNVADSWEEDQRQKQFNPFLHDRLRLELIGNCR